MFELRFTEVFSRWLEKLDDAQARARIAKRLRTMERGSFGDVKPVGQGISEARVDFGPG